MTALRVLGTGDNTLELCAKLGLGHLAVAIGVELLENVRQLVAIELRTDGGEIVDRFDVRRIATELIDARLKSVQKWCEEQP